MEKGRIILQDGEVPQYPLHVVPTQGRQASYGALQRFHIPKRGSLIEA